jgi:hypothetical protein
LTADPVGTRSADGAPSTGTIRTTSPVNPDYFAREFAVVVHEHCEERLGEPTCRHHYGLPIDAYEAIRVACRRGASRHSSAAPSCAASARPPEASRPRSGT